MANLNRIHIIDCSDISEKPLKEIQHTEKFKIFSEKFGNALKLNGIVYLINTGIDKEVISNAEEKLSEFYSLPFDAKKKYEIGSFGNIDLNLRWGWEGPYLSEPGDNKETFNFPCNPKYEDDTLYPKEVSGLKDAILTFRKRTRCLSTKLLRGLGEYLKLEDKDFFIHKHSALEENYVKSKFSVRSLYYPMQVEIPENATECRLGAHQDFGTLAHIYQNSDGLQAKLQTGEWVDVKYIPNTFVVNAGRALEMWSGGNIPAVYHRVGWTENCKTGSRISFGGFLAPDRDVCCLPLVEENPHWTTSYTKMKPGETFDDFFKRQCSKIDYNKVCAKADFEK